MHVKTGASGIFGSSADNTDDSLFDLTSEMAETKDNEAREDQEQAMAQEDKQ
jgi:hypothetical protein